MNDIIVYTDGGCSGNPGRGGWAYVIILNANGQTREFPGSGGEKMTTNNRMELTAVIQALQTILSENFLQGGGNAPEVHISIYTDSQYVQKGITQWISGWKRNGWKTAAKESVKNQDLWQELDSITARLQPQWIWVKGHAGIHYNELVDKMTQDEIAKL